jgi:hypothetical protein
MDEGSHNCRGMPWIRPGENFIFSITLLPAIFTVYFFGDEPFEFLDLRNPDI